MISSAHHLFRPTPIVVFIVFLSAITTRCTSRLPHVSALTRTTVPMRTIHTASSSSSSSTSTCLYQALSSEDEEMIRQIRGPLGAKRQRMPPKSILILSDTTGVTAKSAVQKSLKQFNGCDERFFVMFEEDEEAAKPNEIVDDEVCVNLSTRSYPFVRTQEEIARILKGVNGQSVFVVFTFADPALREATARMCELSGFIYCDLLGGMFHSMSEFFEREPLGKATTSVYPQPGSKSRRALSDDYYRRIEAVEYTLKCDDGMKPRLLKEADVILLGVSRTGKTPLSVVLAQVMGLKVANIPLVVDLPPPRQLFDPEIDPRRVFCLTLDPDDLLRIRRFRMSRELSHASEELQSAPTNYVSRQYLLDDLAHARRIASEHGFTEIDVTGRAVEETASWIYSLLNDRFPGEF